ncbi:carboxylesterase [Phenylobacterium sp.]|uniref:alpha/beta hydrolase n=1 Tax=Phenylobacterium sp. TaxID=1871053 RepID=UPI002736C3D9|nr:alpha/beta hydrolase [Phenylobacterium sp.]MDP3658977.1 alpha/beta hydrolase [Phenylobacterium sp.]
MNESTGMLPRPGGEHIAWRAVAGAAPTIVWMSGFRSDMAGTKALALADWAKAEGRGFLAFDYFGHGASSGDFADGTITRWREDALAAIDELTKGPLIIVGSSMGGWIACLAAMVRAQRVAGMVLVAPAADFTEKLMTPELSADARSALETDGVWLRPSLYGDAYPITRTLLEDGARWSILPGPVPIEAPVRILQGGEDPDVPWRHALELAQALNSRDLVFSLIRDGDHRLSRPQDIARLLAAVEELCG